MYVLGTHSFFSFQSRNSISSPTSSPSSSSSSPPSSASGADDIDQLKQEYRLGTEQDYDHEAASGSSRGPNGRRKPRNPIPDERKDDKYWKRRLKNNMAAKRSREAKREKENQLTMRAQFLEREHRNLM